MGNWQLKLYKNDEEYTVTMVNNRTQLNSLRIKYNISQDYYFVSKDNIIIYDETNFTVKDIYQNDPNGGYKIDIMTDDYFQSCRDGLVTLYRNGFKHSSIKCRRNMTLEQIENKMNGVDNNDNNSVPIVVEPGDKLYFLTPNKTIIRNQRDMTAKDVITINETKKEKEIYLVTKRFYQKQEIIDHLNNLESMEKIEWLSQEEFFKKIETFCGNIVLQGIQNELFGDIQRGNKVNDKDFIKKFKKLLIEDNNRENSNTRYSDL